MEIKSLQQVNISAPVSSPFSLSWSEDNKISVSTREGLIIMAGLILKPFARRLTRPRPRPTMTCLWFTLGLCLLILPSVVSDSNNITDVVFGTATDVMPAAFGDFNSDELTDMFVLRDGGRTVQVLLAARSEPFLAADSKLRCHFKDLHITSLVPGDFDGDLKMDILVTAINRNEEGQKSTHVFIHWGDIHTLNCSNESFPVLKLIGQPLAIDYNRDTIVDLFGSDLEGNRTVWIFNKNRTTPMTVSLADSEHKTRLRAPHSHAFLDINGDFAGDIIMSTTEGFEIWNGKVDSPGFIYNTTIQLPRGIKLGSSSSGVLGQSVFLDLAQTETLDHVVPVCYDAFCHNSSLLVLHKGVWVDLNPSFTDPSGRLWGFVYPNGRRYTDTLTVRVGDFNMDGYFDLVATLQRGSSDEMRSFLLENTECTRGACKSVGRSFSVRWGELSPLSNQSVMATFYDVHQDGVLDIIVAGNDRVQAFRIDLEYDSNFIKVMVGQGGNLPGPWISYKTSTQEGEPKVSSATQLPQSAHFSLALPYVIFGLGRTPNFVDTLLVGLGGKHKEWTQIIPNSQMVVVLTDGWPSWKAKLFVTPSKLILLSVLALLCTCVLIAAIIGVLYWKERREDRLERLQEAHKFHFDAM